MSNHVRQVLYYLCLSYASSLILYMSVMCLKSFLFICVMCINSFLFISDMCIISYIIYVSHMRQSLYYFYLSCASILKACRLYHDNLLLQNINDLIIHVLKNFFSASDIKEAVRGRFRLYCMNAI